MIKRLDIVVAITSNTLVKRDKEYTVLGVMQKDKHHKVHYYIATETKKRRYCPADWFILRAILEEEEMKDLERRLEDRGF